MLSLTRLFKGLLGDKNSSVIICSSDTAPQPSEAAASRGYPSEANCLSAVFFRGGGNGSHFDEDDARPDTGGTKTRGATSGRSAIQEARPVSGMQLRDDAVATEAFEGRRMAVPLWKKSPRSGRLPRKTAASREAEPTPPVQPDFCLPDTYSEGPARPVIRERVTCPPAAAAQHLDDAAATALPERHTFPKAQASQPPRPRPDPESETDWNGSSCPYHSFGQKLTAASGGRGQLLPAQPPAAAVAPPHLAVLRAARPFHTAREPGLGSRATALVQQQQQQQQQSPPPPPSPLPPQRTQQQPVQSMAQDLDLARPLDQGVGAGVGMSVPQGDGLLFLTIDVPTAMLRPEGGWSTRAYHIVQQLHRGYASSVFRAVCRKSGSDVVLKAYNLASLSDFLLYQVLRELDIHSRIRHPAVVKLLAAFKEGDALVMVQEYAGGGSACRVRRKLGGRMTEFQAMHLVLLPLLGVLTYLHERGIVHRDIKPENLLFTESWQLKLCDYGVSICTREERAVTRTGSREYMAPEVSSCPLKHLPEDNKDNLALSYGTAVDVWSLGSLMYELLVGFTPFPGGPPARKDGEPSRGSAGVGLAFPSSISQSARAFIRDCLELEPADRPTVQQLLGHTWVQEALVDAASGAEGALLAAEERRWQRRSGPAKPQSAPVSRPGRPEEEGAAAC